MNEQKTENQLNPDDQKLIAQIAKTAYAVNKAYAESLGDASFEPWKYVDEWQVETLINGVQFHKDNPDATPEDSHANWLKEKEAKGWVYGEVKDPEKKTHPCMVPYQKLPHEQRLKDSLFMAVVKSFLVPTA